MRKLNKDQRKFLADFLNGLSIAWFSVGVISPLFVKVENVIKLGLQIIGSLLITGLLLFLGVKLLGKTRSKGKYASRT